MATKSLAELFELYVKTDPKDADSFLDKPYTVDKKEDRNGNKDDVFKATNIKQTSRKADNHGYDHGEDEEVGTHSKKSVKKTLPESFEGLDESKFVIVDQNKKIIHGPKDYNSTVKMSRKKGLNPNKHVMPHEYWQDHFGLKQNEAIDLDESISKVCDHLIKRYGNKEEVDQIDELSNKTLVNYKKKASRDRVDAEKTQYSSWQGKEGEDYEVYPSKFQQLGGRIIQKRRERGLAMANNKLKKLATPREKQLTKEDIINRTLDKYLPEQKSLDEKFINNLLDLSETHISTLYELFTSLDETNQKSMIVASETSEGINDLLDFAIDRIDEISKSSLGNYIDASHFDKSHHSHEIGRINQIASTTGTTKKDREDREYHNNKHGRRSGGIGLAVKKLTKESNVGEQE